MRPGPIAVVALVAAALLAPSVAGAAVLAPLKPCYVSVDEDVREQVILAGSAFTPGAPLDISFDGERVGEAVADSAGAFGPVAIEAPHQRRRDGVRAFVVTVTERDNPANTVEERPLLAPLTFSFRPVPRRPRQRVTWRGRGFTGEGKVYAHYLLEGRHRRTVRLGRATGPCGFFRIRARQFPFKPRVGRWIVRIDQHRRWSRKPSGGVFWERRIFVRRAR